MDAAEMSPVVGAGPRKLEIYFGIVTHQTIGDCIKELIEASYNIYDKLIAEPLAPPHRQLSYVGSITFVLLFSDDEF